MAKYNDDKKFDVDLEYGQQREKEIANILEKGKLEVKSERNWWWKTNNIAIEVESYGMPSGIKTTKAKYWVIYDGRHYNWFLTKNLQKCVKDNLLKEYKFVCKGDIKTKKAYLIKNNLLFKYKDKIHS